MQYKKKKALVLINQSDYLKSLILTFVNVLFILSFSRCDKRGVFRPSWERNPSVIQNLQKQNIIQITIIQQTNLLKEHIKFNEISK